MVGGGVVGGDVVGGDVVGGGVVGVCLATDLFSVQAWGGERPPVPICLLWPSASWLHPSCRRVSDG